MGCPYLTEVKMSFCSAFPVKKLVPTERVVTASACEDDAFAGCPVYREARARGEGGRPASSPPEMAERRKEGGGS